MSLELDHQKAEGSPSTSTSPITSVSTSTPTPTPAFASTTSPEEAASSSNSSYLSPSTSTSTPNQEDKHKEERKFETETETSIISIVATTSEISVPPSVLSPPESPLRPTSCNPPMTSTPVKAQDPEERVSSFLQVNGHSPAANVNAENSNAITVIQVEPRERKEEPGTSGASSSSRPRSGDVVDSDSLGVTRITLKSSFDLEVEERQKEREKQVQVTVLSLNGSGDARSNENDNDEDEARGPVRFDEGIGLSHPSDLNDTVSEMSSVVNNPSVISHIPDRYGFMGGEQYTHESEPDPSPEIVRRREMKWLQMMDKWDHYMRKDFKTVRSRCRKGVPRSVRGRAWYYLCGAAFIKKKQPDLFFRLLEQEGKPSDIEDIKKDLHRQFPWHEIFAEEGHGKKDLFKVLKAHSILNSKDGYCQAQAPIASILLMHMPAEDAFWCLVAICDKYLKGYYSPGMEQIQLDGDILFGLLKRVAPPVYKHIKKQKIDPVLYMTEWFLCAFTRTLPWSSVLRVWDSFLCEGVKVLFRVGLILLKYTLGRPGVLKQCPSMYETLAMLKNLPNYVTHEQFLVHQIQRLDISDDQMRREHYKQVVKRKKAQQKLEAQKKQDRKDKTPQALYKHETSL